MVSQREKNNLFLWLPEAQITNHLILPNSRGGLTKVGKIPENSGLFSLDAFPKEGEGEVAHQQGGGGQEAGGSP